mmetsp:Transcript_12416/g.31467  ORF Transcript_12416/g.31467 Transcript_12416/m.31467 type:complete len:222 (+) Transcript_12416:30-695(+)
MVGPRAPPTGAQDWSSRCVLRSQPRSLSPHPICRSSYESSRHDTHTAETAHTHNRNTLTHWGPSHSGVSLAHVEARVSEALAARNSADAQTPKRERAGRGGAESLFVIVISVRSLRCGWRNTAVQNITALRAHRAKHERSEQTHTPLGGGVVGPYTWGQAQELARPELWRSSQTLRRPAKRCGAPPERGGAQPKFFLSCSMTMKTMVTRGTTRPKLGQKPL